MTLTDKARGLQKQAILGAAVSAIGQNLIGIPIARSKGFKKSLATSAIMGAAGKKAPRTVKSLATDAIAGVAAPEVNAAKNQAYSVGEKVRKTLGLDKASKRDQVVARLSAAGDEAGLKRIGKSKSPIAQTIRETKKRVGLPDISKADQKSASKGVGKLQDGSRAPSSTKAALAANAAILPLPGGASTAAVNVAKLGASSKAAGNSKLLQAVNKKLVTDPIKASAKAGASGKAYNKVKGVAESVLLNPFSSEASRLAHKVGAKSAKK